MVANCKNWVVHYRRPQKARIELLHQLIGLWELERQVIASTGTQIVCMNGIARFAPIEGDISRYYEEGTLETSDGTQPSISFSRRYLYCAEPNGLVIFFDETPRRLFQRFTTIKTGDGWEGAAEHACAPDTYRSLYRFELPHGFAITHHVEGPRKAYTIITNYRRCI
ncbi:DUF6314 family protein [Pseudochelatococcus sp. G4_1912]|uniref:DUF6314 family protein n=1 Tax=Pseudochelatococcus sp. G4_1912 TaxID=3114288 RepID=UPI0039C6AB2C